jgi:ankyrin repeat protein
MMIRYEIDTIVSLQSLFIDITENNADHSLQCLIESEVIQMPSAADRVASAILVAVDARPSIIPVLAQCAASLSHKIPQLKSRLLDRLSKSFACKRPLPTKASSFAFFYQSFAFELFSIEDVLAVIKKTAEKPEWVRSVCWLFSYFAPELEMAAPEYVHELVIAIRNASSTGSFPQMFKHIAETDGSHGWSAVKAERDFWAHSQTVVSLIHKDDIDGLKALAKTPTFSIDLRLAATPYFPSAALLNSPTIIQTAAFFGSVRCFKFLLSVGANLQVLDRAFVSLAQMAVAGGHIEVIRLCQIHQLDFSATLHAAVKYHHHFIFDWLSSTVSRDLTECDLAGQNLCHIASGSNNVALLHRLSDLGIHASPDHRGFTPLSVAVHHGHTECLELLLSDSSLDLSARGPSGLSPLSVAAKRGDLDTARLLIACGARPNEIEEDDPGPLIIACLYRQTAMVEYLLELPCIDPNEPAHNGVPLLLGVVRYGWEDVAESLLKDPRVDANAKLDDGRSVLYYAIKGGLRSTFHLLMARSNIDVTVRTTWGTTLLHMAVEDLEMTRALLTHPETDINAADEFGQTILHKAARCGNLEVVDLLLSHSEVDPNAIARKGGMPLHVAITTNNEAIAERIIQCEKADVNWYMPGCSSPFTLAASKDSRRIMTALIKRRDLDMTGEISHRKVRAPVPVAVSKGMTDIVELLLQHPNMDLDNPACGAKRALSIATHRGLNDCVRLLTANERVLDEPDELAKKKQKKQGLWKRLRRRRRSSNAE